MRSHHQLMHTEPKYSLLLHNTHCHRSRPLPPPGERWFEFNDTHVSPITSPAIEKIFQGKRSAYMLFYRKTSARRPIEGKALGRIVKLFYRVWLVGCKGLVIWKPFTRYTVKPGRLVPPLLLESKRKTAVQSLLMPSKRF